MRPLVHFTPPQNFMNDPNGLVYHAGEYHQFYQHNPFGVAWGHMSWGHAVSRDLVRWEHLPVALAEADGVMIFSGCAVVDHENTSGFGSHGSPPLVAIYTGHSELEQTQNIAFSRDLGRTWTKYPGNPVIAIGSREHRDPKVVWHAPTRRWIMVTVLADKHQVRFYGSPDLIHWEHLSDFGPFGGVGGVWECPDLFTLPIEGEPGESVWALKVDVCRSVGAQVIFGDFDGRHFVPREPGAPSWQIDHGVDFYAAQSWSNAPDDRRVWVAWLSNWEYANQTPATLWRGVFSIPREVGLRRTPNGLRLVQRPLPELQRMRGSQLSLKLADVDEANTALAALDPTPAFELALSLPVTASTRFVVRIQHGVDAFTDVIVDGAARTLSLDRRRSGEHGFSENFAAVHVAPLTLSQQTLDLRIFVDTCSIEVFAEDGLVALSDLIFPRERLASVVLTASGDDPILNGLDLWALNPAHDLA